MERLSKTIKNELKKNGINTSKISVREEYHGYSSVVYINVKNKEIDLNSIKVIANRFRSVDHDERTGETLMGGNTYIDVSYDYSILYPTET